MNLEIVESHDHIKHELAKTPLWIRSSKEKYLWMYGSTICPTCEQGIKFEDVDTTDSDYNDLRTLIVVQ